MRKKKNWLRGEAKGRECQIRIPHFCTGNDEETVLCHDNLPGVSGAGMKAPDLCGAWGCSVCHEIVDGRRITHIPYNDFRLMFYEGMSRTLNILKSEGKLP